MKDHASGGQLFRELEKQDIELTMRYFILGTDTGVGKTVLSLLFMSYFLKKGRSPFYLKPFQTGCTGPMSPDSDARFIYENIRGLASQNPGDSMLYCLKEPKAPYFAARSEGKTVDMEKAAAWIADKSRRHDPLIIEGAGGLLVPITQDSLMADLLEKTGARPVVAARAGLGTINHTLLTLEALKRRGHGNPAVVFIDKDETDPAMIRENMEGVQMMSGVSVAGVIGKLENFQAPTPTALEVIRAVVEGVSG